MITQEELNRRIRQAQKEADVTNIMMGEWLGTHRSAYSQKLAGVHPWTWPEVEELNEIFRQDLTKEG